MSNIPFVDELGDALDHAIAGWPARGRSRRARRVGFRMRRRGLVLALLAVLLLAGVGVAAATWLGSSQQLADGRVNCFFSTAGGLHSARLPDASGSPSVGHTPIAVCRRWYRLNAHTGLNASTLGFVACRHTETAVSVFVADGRPRQCQRLGDRPLPPAYPAAVARLHSLQTQLMTIQRHRSCDSPRTLARQVRGVLTRLGLDDWRIQLPPSHPTPRSLNSPAGTGGTCGSLIGDPAANAPDFPVELSPNRDTVSITVGPPRDTATRVYRQSLSLYQHSYQHCFTAAALRTLTRRAFTPLKARFTTNAAPSGEGYLPASRRLYDRGCVRFEFAYVANNNRFVDVWFYARGAPRLPAHRPFPAASAFRP